jgi:hypothetical protein
MAGPALNAVVKGATFNAELARIPAPVIAAWAGFDERRFFTALAVFWLATD